MNAEERRQGILKELQKARRPKSASALAAVFHVSRQIIVGDVALLRAAGHNIAATPRGYCLDDTRGALIRRIACRHRADEMRDELYAIVDEGCTALNVTVEHPLYGELSGKLMCSSRHDVDEFIRRSGEAEAQPLSMLTEGIHLHDLSCPDEAAFERVKNRLAGLGVLLEDGTAR